MKKKFSYKLEMKGAPNDSSHSFRSVYATKIPRSVIRSVAIPKRDRVMHSGVSMWAASLLMPKTFSGAVFSVRTTPFSGTLRALRTRVGAIMFRPWREPRAFPRNDLACRTFQRNAASLRS